MELVTILESIIREEGFILLDSTVSPGYAKLVVDTEDGITLDEITRLTRTVKDAGEINELFPEGIRLEVTSPGIDYPMTKLFQYKRNIGRAVRVLHELDNCPSPFEGQISAVENTTVTIENKKSRYSFDLVQIEKCQLVIR
ncbi:MAG: hypothetical protein CMG71_06700 [Candidatus Marinimicrobia bacterium]|nr:hypothetical protein [Candidatus Neomarinimicrobiota bacterium]|tara:strand:- start:2587 stop:3009 length:423 start_codon:yes stop_codon:yes gene_type:complete